MIISYYGKAFIKVQVGDLVIAFNPIDKKVNKQAPKFGSDITLISQRTPVFSGLDQTIFGNKTPFLVDSPGEYEYKGVFIKGYESTGPAGLINTIYSLDIEGANICHLGGLADDNLSPDILEDLGNPDIVIVPIGEEGSLAPKYASKIASSLESKIVIPVLFDKKGEEINNFLKEMGSKESKSVDKLSLKKKDLDTKETEVVVLEIN